MLGVCRTLLLVQLHSSFFLLFVSCLNTTGDALLPTNEKNKKETHRFMELHNERRKFILFVIPFYYPLPCEPPFRCLSTVHFFRVFSQWYYIEESTNNSNSYFLAPRLVKTAKNEAALNALSRIPKLFYFRIPFHNFHFYSFTARRWIECFMHEMNSLNSQHSCKATAFLQQVNTRRFHVRQWMHF